MTRRPKAEILLSPDLKLNQMLMIMVIVLYALFPFISLGGIVLLQPDDLVPAVVMTVIVPLVFLPVVVVLAWFRWSPLRASAERHRAQWGEIAVASFSRLAFKDATGIWPSPSEYLFGRGMGWLLITKDTVEFHKADSSFSLARWNRRDSELERPRWRHRVPTYRWIRLLPASSPMKGL